MSFNNQLEAHVMKAICLGTDLPFRASATQYLAFFTADPTETGSLAAEADYTGYARIPVTKASAWTDGGSTFSNAVLQQLGLCTAGSDDLTHFGLVDTASGAVGMMWSGALGATMSVSAGIQPQFNIGALTLTLD